jgi:hypothetical protein
MKTITLEREYKYINSGQHVVRCHHDGREFMAMSYTPKRAVGKLARRLRKYDKVHGR